MSLQMNSPAARPAVSFSTGTDPIYISSDDESLSTSGDQVHLEDTVSSPISNFSNARQSPTPFSPAGSSTRLSTLNEKTASSTSLKRSYSSLFDKSSKTSSSTPGLISPGGNSPAPNHEIVDLTVEDAPLKRSRPSQEASLHFGQLSLHQNAPAVNNLPLVADMNQNVPAMRRAPTSTPSPPITSLFGVGSASGVLRDRKVKMYRERAVRFENIQKSRVSQKVLKDASLLLNYLISRLEVSVRRLEDVSKIENDTLIKCKRLERDPEAKKRDSPIQKRLISLINSSRQYNQQKERLESELRGLEHKLDAVFSGHMTDYEVEFRRLAGLPPNDHNHNAIQAMNQHLYADSTSHDEYHPNNYSMQNLPLGSRINLPASYSSHGMNDHDHLQELLKTIQPDEEIDPQSRIGTPDALAVNLLEHQKIGLTWLQRQEESQNKGGILADDMGLGKTVQMIALMVSKKSTDAEHKTTLVVCPVALIRQWEREIQVKVKPDSQLSVYVHHSSSSKLLRRWNDFRRFDVVITTYTILAREFKDHQKALEQRATIGSNSDHMPTPRSPFFVGKWFRVILDEAQYIKNKNTQTSNAVSGLHAVHRWCLSGTPMQNSIEELYPFVRFLQIAPYNEERKFSNDITRGIKNGYTQSYQRVRALLKAILLRRTKKSKVDGKPILTLPEKYVAVDNRVFTDDESDYYRALEQKTQLQVNKYINSNSVAQNYTNILVMLLRLRQAACHPKLVEKAKMKNINQGAPTDKEAKIQYRLAHSLPFHLKDQLKGMNEFTCSNCSDAIDRQEAEIMTPCCHIMCRECRAEQQVDASILGDDEKPTCHTCSAEIDFEKRICYEIFHQAVIEGSNEQQILLWCREMRKRGTLDRKAKLELLDIGDDDGEMKDSTKKKYREQQEIGRLGLEKLFPNGWIPSTKVNKCMEIVADVYENYPGEKILVFSSFTSLLDLLEIPMFRDHPNQYLRYDGSMTATERNETVNQFFDDPSLRVMLVSLKAGNVGLTLTCASHVIMLDPFWNPFVEDQAMDRAHRIGQVREVHVHKIVVEGSVEDRILELQEKKRTMIDAALDEGELKNIGRLNQSELLYLFNMNREA